MFIGKDLFINNQIRDKEVRLIDADGSQAGVVPLEKAMEMAAAAELDLVKIAPQADPPVCRIMDYGKHKFEQSKRAKEHRKNQKIIVVKEVRLSPNIDQHDYNTKLQNAIKFLKAGDKVKVSMRFRGREMAHTSLGEKLLVRFSQDVDEFGTVDRHPKLEGRSMSIFIVPKEGKE